MSASASFDPYQVLGVSKGASEQEIRAAHRAQIRHLHPDVGGNEALARIINQARDILLEQLATGARPTWTEPSAATRTGAGHRARRSSQRHRCDPGVERRSTRRPPGCCRWR